MMRQKDFKYSWTYFIDQTLRVFQQSKDLDNETNEWECTWGREVGMGMGRWGRGVSFSLENISSLFIFCTLKWNLCRFFCRHSFSFIITFLIFQFYLFIFLRFFTKCPKLWRTQQILSIFVCETSSIVSYELDETTIKEHRKKRLLMQFTYQVWRLGFLCYCSYIRVEMNFALFSCVNAIS